MEKEAEKELMLLIKDIKAMIYSVIAVNATEVLKDIVEGHDRSKELAEGVRVAALRKAQRIVTKEGV